MQFTRQAANSVNYARKIYFLSVLLFNALTFISGCTIQNLLVVGKSVTPIPTPTPTSFSNNAQVTVNANQQRTNIPPTAFGMNTGVWDNHLLDPVVPDLLHGAGVTLLRFPGGSTSDVYHWKSHTITQGKGYVNRKNTFDAFMGVVQKLVLRL